MEQSWLSDLLEEDELQRGSRAAVRYNEGKEVVTVTGLIVHDPKDPRPRMLTIIPDSEPGSKDPAQTEDRLVMMQISFDKVIASMSIVTKETFLALMQEDEE